MINKVSELVSSEQVLSWLIVAFLVLILLYKEAPGVAKFFSERVLRRYKSEETDKTLSIRMDAAEKGIEEVKEKINRDYYRLNDIEERQRKAQKMVEDSLEEREIIMEALLGALGGLQELGANGPTKAAEGKIREYLNKKAHQASKAI